MATSVSPRCALCGNGLGGGEKWTAAVRWLINFGGKTKAEFFKSHDEKYVFKEVNQKEFKMFTEFGPLYFEYMAKVLYHNYPCCLAKILGAYVIKQKAQK